MPLVDTPCFTVRACPRRRGALSRVPLSVLRVQVTRAFAVELAEGTRSPAMREASRADASRARCVRVLTFEMLSPVIWLISGQRP